MSKYFFFIFVFSYLSVFAMTDPSLLNKIDPSILQKYKTEKQAEYIVLLKNRKVFDTPLTLKTKNQKANFVHRTLLAHAAESQKALIQMLKSENVNFRSFYITNAVKVTSNKEVLMKIAGLENVERIIDDAPFKMLDFMADKGQSSQRVSEPEWGIKYMKADSVWLMGIRGEGVLVGGQDTGYDWEVSPLKSKYRGYIDSTNANHNYSWHDAILRNNPIFPDTVLNPCGYNLQSPCDDQNHGTHTMGTMVGEDADNSIGVAPGAKWIACRNMDRGWGQPSTYMDCFEWFLAPTDLKGENPDPSQAPHVINNSWYCSDSEGCNPSNFGLMEEIVKNLKASGIVVVVSAGNSGSEGCGSVTGPPAFFEPSFSVGATDINGGIAGFSSRGPVVIDSSFRLKPNVAAPGVNVRSVIRGGQFASFSGTSMAGPHVAGLVALIISANPTLAGNVEAIEDIIEATSTPTISDVDCGGFLGANVPNAVFGYGIVNALEAVRRAKEFSTETIDGDIAELLVFPNPVDEYLTWVVKNGTLPISKVSIYQLNGQLVKATDIKENHLLATIDVSVLQKGIYIYEAKVGDQWIYGKFVKN